MTDATGPDPGPDPARGTAGWSDVEQAAGRTQLSWRRTVLSALAVVLLAAVKVALTAPGRAAAVVVGLMALGWFAIGGIAQRRMIRLRSGQPVLINRSPALVALLVTALALLATALLR